MTETPDLQPDAATANYNLDVLRDFRVKRFQESIDKNPYFACKPAPCQLNASNARLTHLPPDQPFTGMAVSQAAFTFIYRFMANKSAENPEGILNKATLKSFYSITGVSARTLDSDAIKRIGTDVSV